MASELYWVYDGNCLKAMDRRECQQLDREIAEVRDASQRLEESEAQVQALLE